VGLDGFKKVEKEHQLDTKTEIDMARWLLLVLTELATTTKVYHDIEAEANFLTLAKSPVFRPRGQSINQAPINLRPRIGLAPRIRENGLD
jgi:hypothetical protein